MVSPGSISTLGARSLAAFERLADALSDPARRYRAMLALGLAYGLAWALYAVIAKSSQGMNADMAEMVVWAHEPALGYPKHPPLLAWILAAWFSVLPQADWSFYLLSGLNLGLGLFAAFVLAGEWLDGPKRAAVPFVLALIPFYNFIGLKFDQNSSLIPLWGFTAWAFMRSLDTRRPGWAALAGLIGAAALLTKYWSAFLLLSLFLAALADRRRPAYFRSWAPYISIGVGALAFAPHLYWLIREHFPPFAWVATRRGSESLFDALRSLSEYSFGTLGYAAVAIVAVFVVALPAWNPTPEDTHGDRRTAHVLFWTPLLAPVVVAFVTHTNLLSLWNTPALNLLPVLLLLSPDLVVGRRQVARLAALASAVTLAALLASPLVAAFTFRQGVENDAAYARPLAAELQSQWRQVSDRPLKLIGGPFGLINSTAFYIADHPATFADFSYYLAPWVDQQGDYLVRDGLATACPATEAWCHEVTDALMKRVPASHKLDVDVTPRWLGFAGGPQRFTIAILPPSQ